MIRARADAILDAERLARLAQRELAVQPGHVESDLAVASADQGSAILVLVDPQMTVLMAHRLAWRGRPAADMIPNFSRERFERVARGRAPELQELLNPPRVSVMVPYITEGKAGQIRNDGRGVIYQEYDLSYDFELGQWEAQQRMWPLLLGALVFALGLAYLTRLKVTQPLARVELASPQLAQKTAFPEPLEVTGPREIARLAHGFNVMVERIQHAQHDSEASRARLAAIVEAAMDAIITVDGRHRIMVINAAALAMFRCREQDMLGQPIHMLLPDRFRTAHQAFVDDFAQNSGTTSRTMGRQAVVTGRRLRSSASRRSTCRASPLWPFGIASSG
jgi:PAS domain S-box-containing protein